MESFRDALDKKERKEFDDVWEIAKLYVSECSNFVQMVPLQPIIMSILFHHYKELMRCTEEVQEIMMMEANDNSYDFMMEKEKF